MTTIIKKNEIFLKVEAEPHLHKELSEHFQFEVPGAKYMPAVKRRYWDGKIRLYSPGTGEIYVGLFDYLTDYLEQKGYQLTPVNSGSDALEEIDHNYFDIVFLDENSNFWANG